MREDRGIVEQAVLGGILLWEDAWPNEVLELEPEYFGSVQNANILAAAKDLIAEQSPVDEVSVYDKLKAWDCEPSGSYLVELVEGCPTKVNLSYWSRLLVEDGRKRAAQRAIKQVVERAGKDATAEQITGAVQDAIRQVKPKKAERGIVKLRDCLQPVVNQLVSEHENPETARAAMTGLRDLDAQTELREGQLTIIAGRPSMGKSALAGNIASHCAKDIVRGAVVLFSLEMDMASLVRRMMSGESGRTSDSLAKAASRGELTETCAKMYDLNLYIDDRPHLGIDTVRRTLSSVGKVRLVVFDYLQLAKLDAKQERHDLRVGAITKGLKGIAKEFGCHTIGLSQLNRSVEQRKPPIPQLGDLRDSGNIEEDADNVWFLYRPAYYDMTKPADEAQVRVAKQRHGRTGVVRVLWQGDTQRFMNR